MRLDQCVHMLPAHVAINGHALMMRIVLRHVICGHDAPILSPDHEEQIAHMLSLVQMTMGHNNQGM